MSENDRNNNLSEQEKAEFDSGMRKNFLESKGFWLNKENGKEQKKKRFWRPSFLCCCQASPKNLVSVEPVPAKSGNGCSFPLKLFTPTITVVNNEER